MVPAKPFKLIGANSFKYIGTRPEKRPQNKPATNLPAIRVS